jgi:hypothetical protein
MTKTIVTAADEWVRDPELRRMLGGVSAMCLWRWRRELPDFPTSSEIGGKRYTRRSDIEAFMQRRVRRNIEVLSRGPQRQLRDEREHGEG